MFMEGFHDALILYAIALREVTSKNLTKKNGLEITHRMWNRTFEGNSKKIAVFFFFLYLIFWNQTTEVLWTLVCAEHHLHFITDINQQL